MPATLAIAGLACDVALVLSLLVAASATALMVGSVAGAYRQVVLGAAVGSEDVFRDVDVEFFDRYWLWHVNLNVEAAVPVAKGYPRSVVLDRYEANGADV